MEQSFLIPGLSGKSSTVFPYEADHMTHPSLTGFVGFLADTCAQVSTHTRRDTRTCSSTHNHSIQRTQEHTSTHTQTHNACIGTHITHMHIRPHSHTCIHRTHPDTHTQNYPEGPVLSSTSRLLNISAPKCCHCLLTVLSVYLNLEFTLNTH